MTKMPIVNLNNLSKAESILELNAIKLILKRDGSIRATKPKMLDNDMETRRAAYIWRMVCFFVSPKRQHQCIPVTADFDLCDSDWKDRENVIPFLDSVVNDVVDTIPKSQWKGVHSWGMALGAF